MTLQKLNIYGSSSTKENYHPLPTMFLDIKQNSDMKFPSVTVDVSFWVVDVDFLDTQRTWIWTINFMNFHVSL